jgi:hypothetical protein
MAVAKDLLMIRNFYSTFVTVDRHFVLLLSVPAEPVRFLPSITSVLRAWIAIAPPPA